MLEMENKVSFYGDAIDKFNPFFDNPTDDHNTEWKRHIEKYGKPELSECERKYDYELITADFLINNIDLAFYAWENFPWCNNLSFDLFCEYILPYRCGNEHLTNDWRKILLKQFAWLPDSVKNNTSMANAYSFLYSDINKWMTSEFEVYPFNISLENLLKFKDGNCHDENNMYQYACRAMGITVISDYLPGWGKRKQANHRWHILIDENGDQFVMTENKLHPIHSIPVHASYFTLDSIGRKYIPTNYQVLESKGITKIYRDLYSKYPDALANINNNEESIPDFFKNSCLKDVTSEYITCKNICINNISTQNKYAYLCVFNSYQWSSHCWSEIYGDSAVFNDVGLDALYLPTTFDRNKYQPVAYPFILDSTGQVHTIIPDTKNKRTLRLDRKYPLFANIVNFANYMIGGRFETATKPDFSDAEVVHEIKSTPLYFQEFTIIPGNYRYIRYIAPAVKKAELAELSVEVDNGSGFEPFTCSVISDTPGVEYNGVASNAEKIIDNNLVSYFVSKNNGGWVGLDLETNVNSKKLKVRFCPRNDDNMVTPGKTYELRYWDKEWITLDIKKAENYWIEFEGVPRNAVYWLHCLNGGTEERIFTVKMDGKVLWW